jgi:UDP-N-acetylglucosamine 2-epimerase
MTSIHAVTVRPNFMEIAPIVAAVDAHKQAGEPDWPAIAQILLHKGQHYDKAMSATS